MLDDLILPDQLKALAGAGAFKRGEAYFLEGRAKLVSDEIDRVAGSVAGSGRKPYLCQIQADGDKLGWVCTCPVGERGEFCKHLVSLALMRLASGDEAPHPAPGDTAGHGSKKLGKRRSQADEIRAFLEGQDQARLVEWLLEVCRWDRATRERVLLAARAGGPSSELKKLVTEVTRVHGFLDYHDMPEFARRVGEMIDALARLRGPEQMDLTEYAVDRLHKILEACDDSDGYMGDLLERLAELHIRASIEAKPDPLRFARWLFERQLADDWGTWPGPEAYQQVLGETGMAEYARLARATWDKLPARAPGDAAGRASNRFRITQIMESLARLSGDPEARVEIQKKDLSNPYGFLCIAEIYQQAGRHDAALAWAERGLAAFPNSPDWRLQDFLVEEYFRRGRPDAAMAVAWAQFGSRGGGPDSYKTLMLRARRTAEGETWRTRALEAMHTAAIQRHERYRPLYGRRPEQPDFTDLVRALLWDEDLGAALAAAKTGLCHVQTLIDLARALGPTQPLDAIELYKRAVHPIVELKKNDAYAEATGAVGAMRNLYKALGREREFGDWLAELRLAHKPKRNFMKLLDAL